MFIVEFLGPKGWEIGYEGSDAMQASRYFRESVADGYDARITVPANDPYFGNAD